MRKNTGWLDYAKRLQAIAQSGLAYCKNEYDRKRFEKIREISVEIMSQYTEISEEKIKNLFANEAGYQTPKIDVRAAIFKAGEILLIKEKIDGLWALPGGWADINCSLKENLIREAKEEAGVKINPKRIISVFNAETHNSAPNPFCIYKFFVECEFISGEFEENIETLESGFFSCDNLPSLSTTRNTREQIKLCFETRKKACHQAIFD